MVELLSPAGNFTSLRAAIQNGANAVYLGTESFSARASAENFNLDNLEEAIDYAHLRNAKVHLALNTLIKNDELDEALFIASKAYEFGIDAIIVQDLGLASFLIKNLPELPIHASTQLTIHNLQGVNEAEKLGFKRVVLSRELNISEIQNICKNTNIEIECFIHGALCISYSGQCLMSSMIGGRSGNRGKCAQSCRLPYELYENNKKIDNGYLLSPKDLCGLEFLPDLIDAGVCSFKIEGRLKTTEYVGTVTRIYRKYIDKILNNKEYIIEDKDRFDLLQVFNRGNFSCGHLSDSSNKELIYKYKPNNTGIYIGNVTNFNKNKGHISFNVNYPISLGDSISFEKENSLYTISELMKGNTNIQEAFPHDYVTIGRMKGNINSGDKIFKMSSKALNDKVKESISGSELIKNKVTAIINIHKEKPISLEVKNDIFKVKIESDIIPVDAINSPITEDRIIKQLSKTGNTPFEFENIKVNLDDGLYITSISSLNELRRTALAKLEKEIISRYKRKTKNLSLPSFNNEEINKDVKISLLLNIINKNYDYSKLQNIDKLYIPLKYFLSKEYNDIVKYLTSTFNTYIYMPTIIRDNYKNMFINIIEKDLKLFTIRGFVISNIGDLELIKNYLNDYDIISNYTLNVYNNLTDELLINNTISAVTLSPELNKNDVENFTSENNTELIVYGNLPVMNSNYCLLGKANKCYPDCDKKCTLNNKYFIKDRMGFFFRAIPDNIQTVTTIYNSKTTFLDTSDLNIDYFRIDILDENIDEINEIINCVLNRSRLEGNNYTNGNFNRNV